MTTTSKTAQRFDPGALDITPGAVALRNEGRVALSAYYDRHVGGEWGEFPRLSADQAAEASAANDAALGEAGGFVCSQYATPGGEVWIVTYVGQSTTIMTPDEY